MTDEDRLLDLLRELDDPASLARPQSFDSGAAADHLSKLQRELESAFRCNCVIDAWPSIQDATHFGRLTVPAAATATGATLVVVVSNFWPLAMYALENPGIYDASELDVLLEPRDASRIATALANIGYVVVPEQLLWRAYDGTAPFKAGTTWWDRYFDYL